MNLPTIEDLKSAKANEYFFRSSDQGEVLSVCEYLYEGMLLPVLKVKNSYGANPIYRIDPDTLALRFLTYPDEDYIVKNKKLILRRDYIEDLRRRFFNRVIKQQNDGCWLWQGPKQQQGYGIVNATPLWGNSSRMAHWVSLFLQNGIEPNTNGRVTIHHKCFTPNCVNPEHLILMPHYEQIQHKESTILGIIDKIGSAFPDAINEVETLKSKIKYLIKYYET